LHWRDARGPVASPEIEGQLRAVIGRVHTRRLAPGIQVRRPFPHEHWVVAILPKPHVARAAKQSAHLLGDVAVVDAEALA
jgi:hypothetical protein